MSTPAAATFVPSTLTMLPLCRYKDSVIKKSHDPIKAMPTFSQQKQQHQSSQSRQRTLSSSDDPQAKARERERSERTRAEALIASRRAASSGFKIEETPTPARSEYHDQFNREDVRAAQGMRGVGTGNDKYWERDFQHRPVQIDPGGLEREKKGRNRSRHQEREDREHGRERDQRRDRGSRHH